MLRVRCRVCKSIPAANGCNCFHIDQRRYAPDTLEYYFPRGSFSTDALWYILDSPRRNGKATARKIWIGWQMDDFCTPITKGPDIKWGKTIQHVVTNPSFL